MKVRHSQGHDNFVDSIYEAAVVPDAWPNVLEDVLRIVSARGAVLIAARGDNLRWIASSPEFDDLVRCHYQLPSGAERTRRLLAADRAGFVTDYDVYTPEEMAEDPVFRDLLIPRGYGSAVGTATRAPTGDAFILHAEAPYAMGPVSPGAVALLDEARPHLARAALVSARLALQGAKAMAQALETLGLPGAVLREGGQIFAANALLSDLIPSVLQDRSARLTLSSANSDALLVAALGQLSAEFDSVAVRSIPIRGSATRGPLVLHVLPIRGSANDHLQYRGLHNRADTGDRARCPRQQCWCKVCST
jgi:hypothetical protein